MINLIPQIEKKKMVRNFRYKLVILFLVICSFSFLVISVALMPAYFLSIAKKSIVNEKLKMQQNEPVPLPDEKTLLVIRDLNTKLDIIESVKNKKFIISQKVINAILVKKIAGIQITNISYDVIPLQGAKSGPTAQKVSIQGTASSREVLLLFRQALEDSSNFKQVDLPISNFIKGSDIRFSLSLIPA